MSKKKLVDKALQAAIDARAERYVADPAERAANLAKWQASTPKEISDPRWYHGTFTDVDSLRPGRADATFVSRDPNFANRFATPADKGPSADWDAVNKVWVSRESLPSAPNVMPFHVRAENPFDYQNPEHIKKLNDALMRHIDDDHSMRDVLDQIKLGKWAEIEMPEVQNAIRDLGHDSFYVMESGVKNLGVYDPTRQLKSATGNTGLFDPNIPRIDENRGGSVEREPHADGGPVEYLSTGEKLIGDEGQINWGDPNEARDFFRADAEMMRRRRAEEEATRKIDREAITVSSLPAPGSADQPSAPVPVAAARESDVSPYAVLPLIRQAESGDRPTAQNPYSSASGLYQFTNATWANTLRRMDPERYGRMTDAQLAALKARPETVPLQEQAAKYHLSQDILPTLEKAKIPVNPATIYLGWFQGPQGAVTAYNAPSSATVKELFPNTIAANANLKYRGKPYAEWTRDDLVNWANETMMRRMRGRAEGGPVEEKTLTEAMLGANPELPRGELTMSAPPETSLVQRALHALPSISSYGRAIGEELNAPRRALEIARQINAQSEGIDPDAAKLAALGALGYAISPITAAQNVLIRDPLLKAGAPMDMAQRGVNVSDALGLTGAIKVGAKKAVKKGVAESSALGSGAGTQAQLLGGGYLTSPGLPEDRDGKAVGGLAGSGIEKALELAKEATGIEPATFIGERAFMGKALRKQLEKAQRRLEAGEDPSRVRRLHGWSPDPQGVMTYEMSDKGAKFHPEGLEKFRKGETVRLGELLDHPALFDAYPQSFSRPVESLNPSRVGDKLYGQYDDMRDIFGARRDLDEKKLMGTLLHEHQHRIQSIEGMSPGQNTAMFKGPDVYGLQDQADKMLNTIMLYRWVKEKAPELDWYEGRKKFVDLAWGGKKNTSDFPLDITAFQELQSGKLQADELQKRANDALEEIARRTRETPTQYEQYYRSLGEVTARKPGERIDMDVLERRRSEPITPEDQVILRPPMSNPRPNEPNLDWDIFKNAMEHAAETREGFDRGGKKVAKNIREFISKLEDKPSTVKLPGGREVEAKPIPEIEKAAEEYMQSVGRPGEQKIDQFVSLNPTFASAVARAFEEMKHNPKDPEVRRAYDALIDETMAQYRALKDAGIDFRFLREGQADPYAKSPALGYEDIKNTGRLFVFPTEQGFGSSGGLIADNPLLKRVGRVGDMPNAMANDAFRVVHDAYGHFGPGNPFFRAPGEERAYQLHSRMYSPEALPAMTSETRGQNAWVNFGPFGERNRTASGAETVYADQKIGRLPEFAMRSPDDPNVVDEALRFLREREGRDKGGKTVAKKIKEATKKAQRVFPELATRYPEVAPPVEAIDRNTGKPYLAKELSEEAKALQIARKAAQERIDRGEYTPFFNPAERFDVDPSKYPAYEPTITQRRVKPETQEKYDSMLMAEDVLARLRDAYNRGLLQKEDAENWYMLGQVEAEFIKEFGEKVGREKFKERIADSMAATTGGADPEANWLMAQYGNFMKQQGAEMPKAAYEFPFPVGGRFVAGNMEQFRKMIMEGQGVTPENPKRYNFSYNFLGNRSAPTIDEQMMSIIRPGVNVPDTGTYGHHEAPVSRVAAESGVDPRYFQEVAWAGKKDEKTKGGYKAQPFIQTLNESIERTSQVTGVPPSEVVRKGLVRGEMPMYGIAGATLGAGALSEADEGEPRAKGGTVVSKALMLTSKKAKR